MNKTGNEGIIEQFLADGIKYMFGNPGTVEQGFLDAIEKYPQFEYITTLQETIAVAIADGYARKTGKPAVVQLHSGVGLGNGIGMIYQSMRGHTPLVIIAGEAGLKYDSMDAQMAADLVAMAKPVTKWAARVVHPESLLRMVRRAIKIASTPPMGPVFLCLPMDILDVPLQDEVRPTSVICIRVYPDENTIISMANELAKAKNPIIIMGDGITHSGAQNELAKVAEIVGAQVWGADNSEINMPSSHPLYMGSLGHMFGESSYAKIQNADCVLICGTYVLPEVFPRIENIFNQNAKVMHIDLNSYEIAKNHPVDIGVIGDPKLSLERLYQNLEKTMTESNFAAAKVRLDEYTNKKDQEIEANVKNDLANENANPLYASQFVKVLSKYVSKDVIIFDEALTNSPAVTRYIPPICREHFSNKVFPFGVDNRSNRNKNCCRGQRSNMFYWRWGMYTIQTLWTAVRHNVNAKFVIYNNKSYNLLKANINQYWKERNIEKHQYPGSFELGNPVINFSELSISMGVPGRKVERPEDIEPAIKEMLNTNGPYLIDLVVRES